jgi:hypothetical protein
MAIVARAMTLDEFQNGHFEPSQTAPFLGGIDDEVLRAAGIEHVIVLDLHEASVRANWQEFHDPLERCIARGDGAIVVNLQALNKVDSICDGSQLT